MMYEIDEGRLLEILTAATFDPRTYSGRGMYGKQCWAITTNESELGAFAELVKACNDVDEASTLAYYARSDSIGRGTVIYWPEIEASKEKIAEMADAPPDED